MAVSSGSVARLTPSEIAQLANWTFIGSYRRYHTDLVDLARGVYTATCHVLNAAPTEDQFYRSYKRSLRWTDLYTVRIAGKKHHLPPSLHEYFADLLAKYVLEQDWGTISSAPCP